MSASSHAKPPWDEEGLHLNPFALVCCVLTFLLSLPALAGLILVLGPWAALAYPLLLVIIVLVLALLLFHLHEHPWEYALGVILILAFVAVWGAGLLPRDKEMEKALPFLKPPGADTRDASKPHG